MFGLPFGIFVESAVSILLAVTIGYCVVLNRRLGRLHADRDELRIMVTDLMQATELANSAVQELKQAATEADLVLNSRLEEAERFGIELANHVSAGRDVMDRIARITQVAQAARPASQESVALTPAGATKLQAALQQLVARERSRGDAA